MNKPTLNFYFSASIFGNKNHSITEDILRKLNLLYLFIYYNCFLPEKKFCKIPSVSFLIIVLDITATARAGILIK